MNEERLREAKRAQTAGKFASQLLTAVFSYEECKNATLSGNVGNNNKRKDIGGGEDNFGSAKKKTKCLDSTKLERFIGKC